MVFIRVTQVLNARLKIVGGRNEKSTGASGYSGDLSYLDASQMSSMPRYPHSQLQSTASMTKQSPTIKSYPYRKNRSGTGISVTVSQEVHTTGDRGQPQPVHIPMVDIDNEVDIESDDAVRFHRCVARMSFHSYVLPLIPSTTCLGHLNFGMR